MALTRTFTPRRTDAQRVRHAALAAGLHSRLVALRLQAEALAAVNADAPRLPHPADAPEFWRGLAAQLTDAETLAEACAEFAAHGAGPDGVEFREAARDPAAVEGGR